IAVALVGKAEEDGGLGLEVVAVAHKISPRIGRQIGDRRSAEVAIVAGAGRGEKGGLDIAGHEVTRIGKALGRRGGPNVENELRHYCTLSRAAAIDCASASNGNVPTQVQRWPPV